MILGIAGKKNSGKDEVAKIIQYLTSDHGLNNTRTYQESIGKIGNDGYGYAGFGRYNSPFEIKKFADKLKDITCLLLDSTREDLESEEFKNKELSPEWWYFGFGDLSKFPRTVMIPYFDADKDVRDSEEQQQYLVKLTPRLLLQLLGTDCGRKVIHPNIWVNSTMSNYRTNFEIKDVEEWGKDLEDNWIISDVRFPNEVRTIKEKNGIVIKIRRPCLICNGLIDHKLDCQNNYKEHVSETALDHYSNCDYIIDNIGTIDDLVDKVKIILKKEKCIN